MKSIALFIVLACSVFLNTASAQTPDPCPVKHAPLTALDHDSMLAAYTASFEGIYHRAPSLQPGSGVDDGNYWISVSDHFGMFSDGVCRAGWSRYWEDKLTGKDSAPPADADLPALYQPGSVTPTPVPEPPAPPVPDLTPRVAALENSVATLQQTVGQLTTALQQLDAATTQQVNAITLRLNALEAKPIPASCSASISGIPIHCALKF